MRESARHFNELSPAQAERLAILLEEMGEAQQVIGKILRHGYHSSDPTSGAQYPPTNRDLLEKEIGDVCAAIRMLSEARDIEESKVSDRMDHKRKKIRRYLHHQPEVAHA